MLAAVYAAFSSWPGYAPTHEETSSGERIVTALAPTSAMICCAKSTPSPGTIAGLAIAFLMLQQQTGNPGVQLSPWVMVWLRPFFIGKPGCVRSSACIWFFSSTHKARAHRSVRTLSSYQV